MSDLISRSKLIDYFYFGIDDKPIIDGISDRKIIDIIKNQPTAYSVDKVVDELEDELAYWKAEHYHQQIADAKAVSYAHTIEIVKQGGVSDDVCEWKAIGANDNWSTSCDKNSTHNVFGVAWFKRCPYCGRKLKIVGDNDDD